MKKLILICILGTFLKITQADLINDHIDDGASHIINSEVYENNSLILDSYIKNFPGTHVDVKNGAICGNIWAYNYSTVTVYDGLIGELNAMDNSCINIYGGSISPYSLRAWNSSVINLYGGNVGNLLSIRGDASINLYGSNFRVNGFGLSEGDKLSDYCELIDGYYTGVITGILSDGSCLNNTFKIFKSGDWEGIGDIYIIPEPCSVALVGFGGLLVLWRGRCVG